MTGTVVTFCSLRGGLGRGMAIANVGWILAAAGKKVLIIDWDSDAPGLRRCFSGILDPDAIAASPGVAQLVQSFGAAVGTGRRRSASYGKLLRDSIVGTSFDGLGTIDVLPPGQWADTPTNRDVTEAEAAAFLGALRNELVRRYHFVLINTRSGPADWARTGIALPTDVVVVCCTYLRPSIEGAAEAAERVAAQIPSGRRQVRIIPAVFRVETSDPAMVATGRQEVGRHFGDVLRLSATERGHYRPPGEVPQFRSALADTIVALEAPGSDLYAAYADLARAISADDVTTGPPNSTGESHELLISYASRDRAWADWAADKLHDGRMVARLHPIDREADLSAMLPAVALAEHILVLFSSSYAEAALAPEMLALATDGTHVAQTAMGLLDATQPATAASKVITLGFATNEDAAERGIRQAFALPPEPEPAGPGDRLRPRFPGEAPRTTNLPARNLDFTGRNEILDRLRDGFLLGSKGQTTQLLVGLPGVGKTSLAIEFAHRFGSDYDIVWWVPAASHVVARGGLADLSRALGIPDGQDDAVVRLLGGLRHGRPTERWLLIFDSADVPDDLAGLLPSGTGHVLVTSRNEDWDATALRTPAATLRVGVFVPDEAVAYLRARLPDMSTDEAIALAERLGRLPLAVSQARAYLEASHGTAEDYLARIGQADDPVAAGWLAALGELHAASPAAARLLDILAFLAPEPIPPEIYFDESVAAVLAPLDTMVLDPIRRERLPKLLARHGLAQIAPRTKALTIHRLLQAVIRGRQSAEDAAANRALALRALARANPGDPDSRANWPRYDALWPHVVSPELRHLDTPEIRKLIIDLIGYRYKLGDYGGSEELARETLEVWSVSLGPEHLDTLITSSHRARALRRLGRFNEAWRLDEDTLAALTLRLGENDEYTLMVASGLASDLRAQGRYDLALARDEDTVQRALLTLGPDDRRTLEFRSNLATSHRLLGHAELAREISEDTLRRRIRELGPEHPYTAYSENSLGRDLRDLGRFEESRGALERSLQIYRRSLGDDHPDTLRAAKNLAVTLRRLASFEAAYQLAVDTHRHAIAKLGPKHPETLVYLFIVATISSALDRHDRARQQAQEALRGIRQALHDDHPYTMIAQHNLAAVELRCAPVIFDVRVMERTSAAMRDFFGPDHWMVSIVDANRANHLAAAGELYEARFLDAACAEQLAAILGPRHPDAIAAGINLAIGYEHCGEYDEAEKKMDEVVPLAEEVLGPGHPLAAAARGRKRWTYTFVDPPPLV